MLPSLPHEQEDREHAEHTGKGRQGAGHQRCLVRVKHLDLEHEGAGYLTPLLRADYRQSGGLFHNRHKALSWGMQNPDREHFRGFLERRTLTGVDTLCSAA